MAALFEHVVRGRVWFGSDLATHSQSKKIRPGNRAGVLRWKRFPARLPISRLEKPRSR